MRNTRKKAGMAVIALLVLGIVCVSIIVYAKKYGTKMQEENAEAAGRTDDGSGLRRTKGFAGESAEDALIDFAALREINPDIFAWTHIPDTAIDSLSCRVNSRMSFMKVIMPIRRKTIKGLST